MGQKIRKLRRLIRVRDGIIGNKMAEFSLVVEAPVCGYHAYMDQWEAAINTSLFFEHELGEHDFSERPTIVYIGSDRSFIIIYW